MSFVGIQREKKARLTTCFSFSAATIQWNFSATKFATPFNDPQSFYSPLTCSQAKTCFLNRTHHLPGSLPFPVVQSFQGMSTQTSHISVATDTARVLGGVLYSRPRESFSPKTFSGSAVLQHDGQQPCPIRTTTFSMKHFMDRSTSVFLWSWTCRGLAISWPCLGLGLGH